MHDFISRITENLIGRFTGPMTFRLVLQPVMAAVFAVLGGLKDAKAGKPPYSWTLFTKSSARPELLKEGWKSVGRIFILALVMDAIYQFVALKAFYPLEALIVAFVLAIVPFLLIRGTVNRIASPRARRRWAETKKG